MDDLWIKTLKIDGLVHWTRMQSWPHKGFPRKKWGSSLQKKYLNQKQVGYKQIDEHKFFWHT